MRFRYLLSVVMLMGALALHAQTDTLKVSEEYYQERDPNLILVPSGRIRPTFDESEILKLGTGIQAVGSGFQYGVSSGNFLFADITYERKVKDSPWSITASLIAHDILNQSSFFNYGLGYYKSSQIAPNEWERSFGEINFQLDLGVKYYYRQERRLAQGIGGNNLNGSYFGATLWNAVSQISERVTRLRDIGGRAIVIRETEKDGLSLGAASLYLNWGNQVRILKRGYLDVNIGPAFDMSKLSNWSVIINLKLSIAIWKK